MEKRVIWIVDSLRPGGAERLALRFAAQATPGWQVELVTLQAAPGQANGLASLAEIWGAKMNGLAGRIHPLGMRNLTDFARWRELLRLLRSRRATLLHAHLRYATVWAAAAAPLLGIPFVTTVHLGPQPEAGRRQALAGRLEMMARRRAARVIYVSQAAVEAWRPAAARERHAVIGNGVALPELAASAGSRARERRRLGVPEPAFVLTTVAVVRAPKGWRVWLEAVALVASRCPQARFVWVGGGPEWQLLHEAVRGSRWAERIVLAGPQSDVDPWLAISDLFWFPSLEEAQPTAVMEAMAAGLPVIASDIPAIREVLGEAGRLVPAGEAEALARAAMDWSQPARAAERRHAALAARRRIELNYSEAVWRKRLFSLYAEVLHADQPHAGAAPAADDRVLRPRRTAAL